MTNRKQCPPSLPLYPVFWCQSDFAVFNNSDNNDDDDDNNDNNSTTTTRTAKYNHNHRVR